VRAHGFGELYRKRADAARRAIDEHLGMCFSVEKNKPIEAMGVFYKKEGNVLIQISGH
jgi:hypothetical protein